MRQKNKQQFNQRGFTVIELLVVFLILVTLSSLAIISWNRNRPSRNLTIAQNELVTNIRKTQSYAASSRNLTSGEAVKHYLVKLETGATSYSIHAIEADYGFSDVETINLPQGVEVSNLNIQEDITAKGNDVTCTYLIYSTPFGKVYLDSTVPCDESVATAVQDLPVISTTSDYILNIELGHNTTSLSKSVRVNGLSGKVTPY